MSGTTGNLDNTKETVDTSNDSIVVIQNLETIPGGKTLNVTGFTPAVIKAGHLIIEETSSGILKPLPLLGAGTIEGLGTIAGGTTYVNGTYNGVALTGGTGSGATANITVAGAVVTAVVIVNKGTGYKAGDVLSAAAANIGGTGSGFAVGVASVGTAASGYAALPGSHTYKGVLIASILTLKPFAAVLVRGSINKIASPYAVPAGAITALPLIRFTKD